MVVKGMRSKVRTETAPNAGPHAVMPQNTAQHQRKVPAGAQGFYSPGRAVVSSLEFIAKKLLQALRHRQGRAALTGKSSGVQPIPLEPCFVDQEALQGATQHRNIQRQAADQRVVRAGMGQRAMVGVVVRRRKSSHGHMSVRASKSYQPVVAAQQRDFEVAVVLSGITGPVHKIFTRNLSAPSP